MKQKVLLLILDGFGIGKPYPGNAIYLAGTPGIDELTANNPHTTLEASGLAVGLPKGQMGNSEVGHLNLGAGRVVYQKLTKINMACESGEFYSNKTLINTIDSAKGKNLHIGGLCSDGGVHSSLEHLYEIIRVAKSRGVENIYIHAFLDGRDTAPKSALTYINQIEDKLAEIGAGKIATVSGRFYPMDRDNRWDRTKQAYELLTEGVGKRFSSALEAVQSSYDEGVTDEFVKPCVITKDGENPITIGDGDSFIHFNYRPDRARQLTAAIALDDFKGFERNKRVKINYACMALYDGSFGLPILFTDEMLGQNIDTTLGKVVSDGGLTQLRIAETEKYAHVTYFLNGGKEEKYKGEDRILVPSPKIATYDLQPEMSAPEVEQLLIEDIKHERHNFIVCNFANCDMVGHTGDIYAAKQAVSQVDKSTFTAVKAAHSMGYDVVIIADHGNVEELLSEEGLPQSAHSINPVPCIFIPKEGRTPWELKSGGVLADVTGLLLYLLNLPIPGSMKKSVLLPD
ncbi:MAG TPA: 2,3-bisphosphoglycerate-independent phosphoglycerate mutase [Caldisericia bacterium]|nr:2,3-bisphosphoglycerate-independent phosphoglycerate mutase [Caldisericia bacterium]HPF48347.1 2,3-bisphosphoglycerate-independent phosphoglycerate mutase [Caldisericia bacterium]HPI83474.1 2,3-bisphosphoglycerate-independent phosphoglycerate mutase [Caldisericia bacterium]HPQ92800.1 2,3-bisphosphoglycerate-independent phosphoglycerate mutase [Caldisericia bacterium]HRV74102.1 2,3-bisphosphoglycerate-independent phosphoglycerate mutase [Caldisericia bacterium]